jgi:dipeptidyl aminopeptidase/acylaminoacyl peptidase
VATRVGFAGRVVVAALVATVLWGCATPTAPGEAVVAPNANLVVQGIPPIPQSLVDRVKAYTDFRGHRFVDWHPTERQMLVAHRKAGDSVPQLYLLKGPMAPLQQLTHDAEPVWQASFEPRSGRYVVFERSAGGNEAGQLYRLDLTGGAPVLLTRPTERNSAAAWLHQSSQLIHTALPLDRTAKDGKRTEVKTAFWLVDPMRPEARRLVAEMPGGGWYGTAVSHDDTQLALIRYLSANESQIWLLDLRSGQSRQVLPKPGEVVRAAHYAGDFTVDDRGLYFTSSRFGEFQEAMRLDLASGDIRRMSSHIPWDVETLSSSRDGRRLAAEVNVEGRHALRLFDPATLTELPAPTVPAGSISQVRFHPQRAELAFATNGAKGPSQLYALNVDTGRFEAWTRAESAPGVDMASFQDEQIVRWKSFDGRTISGLMTLPPPRFTGKRPVLIEIHGGPEAQAKVGFQGRYNYFIQELGMALIEPNVRGSSGFGKTFLTLDDGMKREDSVRDIGALLDWIATQPGLDASRVVVSGGSYGGYMSLAVSTHYADRIAGAIDDVGISHFVTFLTNTESYRRDLRRVEYGDERDPVMRAFLDRISPLTNAHKITKPLLVVQGKNDPRVPYTEAEQIVERARRNGNLVWYLRADNEGHGFVRKENADFRFYAMVRFIETVLKP